MRKIRLFIERHFPFIITSLICLLLWEFRDTQIITRVFHDRILEKDFLTSILTALSIVFGFLLTTIIFLMQSNSKAMELIKKHNRENELIKYNKKAVYMSFLSAILTSILLLLGKEYNYALWYCGFKSIWTFIIIYSIMSSFEFLYLFFKLIK